MSWYLMLPPPMFPPVKDKSGDYAVNSKAPLSQWLTLKKLNSQSECKAKLKTMPSFYRCVSSDDPALKKTAAKPKSGPSTSTATGAIGTHMQ